MKYIAKTYVYCPGREVRVMVNGVSRHLYQNTKASEVIIGGARDGLNEVQFTTRNLRAERERSRWQSGFI